MVDQLLVDRPGWLDWPWALRVLDQEVRVAGEEVRPAGGTVATPYLVADEPLAVTVSGGGSHLTVTPSAPALGEFVARRFHLDLDETDVAGSLDKTTLSGLFERDGWVRRPAAATLWSYCLVFLCGGDPDAPPVRRMFAELGRPAGHLRLPPDPADLLTAGDHRIVGYGVAAHRAANVAGLARAFAASPDRYDEVTLRALPGDEAIARVAELPHIGPTRARAIASTALGHDDVLPDLARQDEQLRSRLGLGWTQIRAAARRAVPYRSVLGDTVLELLSD
jgi:3-methyladenine DNA glycosylase/8-oxoguanine DNA glycosylase